jgi:hypothetical protein
MNAGPVDETTGDDTTEVLAAVLPPAQLYDYRAADEDGVPRWAPYQQWDVFRDVAIPGVPNPDPTGVAVLFLHPCTMRRGARLEEHVTVLHARPMPAKKPLPPDHREWRNFKRIPLPDLFGDGASWFGDMMSIGTVASADLPRSNRVAQLSQDGRIRASQRAIHHLTRFAPPRARLEHALRAVHRELELQLDWLEAVPGLDSLDDHQVALLEAEFDEVMGEPVTVAVEGEPAAREQTVSRRDALRTDEAAVVRIIQRSIHAHPAGRVLGT